MLKQRVIIINININNNDTHDHNSGIKTIIIIMITIIRRIKFLHYLTNTYIIITFYIL